MFTRLGQFNPSYGPNPHAQEQLEAADTDMAVGVLIDLGDDYVAYTSGYDIRFGSVAGLSHLRGFVQLWKVEVSGGAANDPLYGRFISYHYFEVPIVDPGGSYYRRTALQAYVTLATGKVLAIGYSDSGSYLHGLVITRTGETLSLGEPSFLIQTGDSVDQPYNGAGGFLDPTALPNDGFDNFYTNGSYAILRSGDSIRVYATGLHACNPPTLSREVLASRALSAVGDQVQVAGPWKIHRETATTFGDDNYAFLYGYASVGTHAYLFAWDWEYRWSLHKFDLVGGAHVASVQTSFRTELFPTDNGDYDGRMVISGSKIITLVTGPGPDDQVYDDVNTVKVFDLDLNKTNEYVGDPRLAFDNDWDSAMLPTKALKGGVGVIAQSDDVAQDWLVATVTPTKTISTRIALPLIDWFGQLYNSRVDTAHPVGNSLLLGVAYQRVAWYRSLNAEYRQPYPVQVFRYVSVAPDLRPGPKKSGAFFRGI